MRLWIVLCLGLMRRGRGFFGSMNSAIINLLQIRALAILLRMHYLYLSSGYPASNLLLFEWLQDDFHVNGRCILQVAMQATIQLINTFWCQPPCPSMLSRCRGQLELTYCVLHPSQHDIVLTTGYVA